MAKLVQLIQEIVENVLEAKKLTESMMGTIEAVNPIKVKIDDRFIVDESVVTFLSHLEKRHLNIGDRLLLLRVKNGQHFIVQDVLESRKIAYYSEGVVLSKSPLSIRVDGKYTVDQATIHVLPYIGILEEGDSILMLRVQSGEKFVVINKV